MKQFLSEKTYNHFNNPLSDTTYKDLLTFSKQQPEVVKRSKEQIFTYYQGTSKDGVVKFLTPSGTQPGKYYFQYVQLEDLPLLIKKFKNKKKPIDIIKIALQGRVRTSCNFPDGTLENAFLYWGSAYKATVSGWNYKFTEDRFPKVRNAKLEGGGCKHVRAVMAALPFHTNIITKDLIKQELFK